MENKSSGKGYLIGITAIIWGFATGMLAICIPLVSMTESGIFLPLAVILVAGIGTIVVWFSSSSIQKEQKISDLLDFPWLATISSVVVTSIPKLICKSGHHHGNYGRSKISQLVNTIEQLEKRVMNLETIDNQDELDKKSS